MKYTHDIIMKFSERVKDIFDMNLSKIILYGSYARGEQRENSDIDLMILTNLIHCLNEELCKDSINRSYYFA